ncbi:MAG: hypothetical protein WA981_13975 [Glaciecola sp.]
MKKQWINAIAILMGLSAVSVKAQEQKRLEFSGFARVVAGQFNQENAEYNYYDDSVTFDEQSLLALRLDYRLTQTLSLVGQGIAHFGEGRKSGVQWLYADYRPNRFLSFKIGKHRTPFFQYSDVLDVGFAYPWITPPTNVYGDSFFNEFTGISGRYDFSSSLFSANFEAYRGVFEGAVAVRGQNLNIDVDYVHGGIFSLSSGNFSLRLAAHEGKVKAVYPEFTPFIQTLEALAFTESANALKIDDKPRFMQFGLAYETFEYFVRAEYKSTFAKATLIPDTKGAYATIGYNYHSYTIFLTASTSRATMKSARNDIVRGVSLELDQLSFIFDSIISQLPFDEADIFSVGARYDINSGLALKAEVSRINGSEGSRAFFNQQDTTRSKQTGTLVQVALEWVF